MVLEGLLTSAHTVPATQAQLKALITGRNITTKAYQERIFKEETIGYDIQILYPTHLSLDLFNRS